MKKILSVSIALSICIVCFAASAFSISISKGDEVLAADAFARANTLMKSEGEGDIPLTFGLRAAYLMDVPASADAMAGNEYFDQCYGTYERVYQLEYAVQYGASPVFSTMYFAVGVTADGTMETCYTLDHIAKLTYSMTWYENAAIELVLDNTLAQAMGK